MDTQAILRKYMGARGLKLTRQRQDIVDEFFRIPDHMSIEDLHHRVRRRNPRVGYATVYRTLKLLSDCGLAHTGKFGDGGQLYEPCLGQGHHDHLICVTCGQIVEFTAKTIENVQKEVARRRRFTLLHHKLELYGYCPKCSPREPA